MHFESARQQLAALGARRVSAVELVDAAIARIEANDSRLNAVVVRDFGRARAAAVRADRARASGERGALLGLPITVKECFNVAGLATTWGIPGTQTIPVRESAVVVSRLEAAGAIILGKTNLAMQLADWQSSNPVYGTTNNPWDANRTPGGSSGGSAAALATGFVSLELGSDLNGSLRIPAHCCGVYGHRPTFAVVPTRGFSPPGVPVLSANPDVEFAVVGPMARSAGDLGLALDVLAGPDAAEGVGYRLRLPAPRHDVLRDYRVLVLDEHPLVPTGNDVREALERFAEALSRCGCRVARSSALLPDLNQIAATFGRLLMAFFGADMPQAAYDTLKAHVANLPPGLPESAADDMRGLVLTHRDWIVADRARFGIAHQWRGVFGEWDIVLCPVLPTPAFAHDHADIDARVIDIDGRRVAYKAQPIWSSVAAVGGLPATAMPIGRSAGGLPIGVQAIGPYLEDATSIRFAELAEREFGGFVAPPGW
jgi:amidase